MLLDTRGIVVAMAVSGGRGCYRRDDVGDNLR